MVTLVLTFIYSAGWTVSNAKLTSCSVRTRGRKTPPSTRHYSPAPSCQSCHQWAQPHPSCCRRRHHSAKEQQGYLTTLTWPGVSPFQFHLTHFVYLLVVARAARLATQPVFHQAAQSVHGSIHDGLATASTWGSKNMQTSVIITLYYTTKSLPRPKNKLFTEKRKCKCVASLTLHCCQLYLGTPLVCSYLLQRSWWWGNLSRYIDHPVTCAGLRPQHQPWQSPEELHNNKQLNISTVNF